MRSYQARPAVAGETGEFSGEYRISFAEFELIIFNVAIIIIIIIIISIIIIIIIVSFIIIIDRTHYVI